MSAPMTRSEVVSEFLKDTKTVLWGRSYDLLEEHSREACINFIARLWQQLEDLDTSLQLEARHAD